MSTLLTEFISESTENLDRVDQDFVALEKRPGDREILARIFRAVHTLKGSCGFLGFSRLEALAHSGEGLLGMLRDGTLTPTPAITTTLLQTMDGVRASLAAIESTGGEGDTRHDALIAQLDALRAGTFEAPPSPPGAPRAPVQMLHDGGLRVPVTMGPPHASAPSLRVPVTMGAPAEPQIEALRRALWDLDRALTRPPETPSSRTALAAAFTEIASCARGFEVVAAVASKAAQLAAEPASAEALFGAAVFLDEALASIDATGAAPHEVPPSLASLLGEAGRGGATSVVPPPAARPSPPPASAPSLATAPPSREEGSARRGIADSKIRVDVKVLDGLMNQVGELVLARNQLLQALQGQGRHVPTRITQRLSQIITYLQDSVMRTRLQPMEIVWNRFPRTVRDLGLELGKQVELVMEGAETELDRSLLEAIRDPMTHLVRNAVDHGIEAPEERVARGKKPAGTLSLRAWHEGGQVNIEIVDDGRGIDVARIEKKALERGLVTPEQVRGMSSDEKIALIFLPGFSTAESVTTVSGRGVGMDVVKSNIDQVNGAIDVQTALGQGTSIRLKIPLTLAIIPALIVESAGERYVIPQVSLLAVVSLAADASERGVEHVHTAAVFRWRGRLLPLVDLSATLLLRERARPGADAKVTVVVLQAADRCFGLMVDAVVDSAEVVVKPVNRALTRARVFAAATIMGDGRAAMILDVLGLAQRAAVVSGRAERASSGRAARSAGIEAPEARQQVLIVRANRELAVVPLTSAIRLEHLPRRAVEYLGGRPVTQYRRRVLPLRHLGAGDLSAGGGDDVLNVVVYTEADRAIGLVVDELVDIAQQPATFPRGDAGALEAAAGVIIQDKVARVLDLPALAREARA